MTTALRPYQQGAIDALEADWATGLLRLGVALPTGTGKTHIMSELANRVACNNRVMTLGGISDLHAPGRIGQRGRVLVLVHRDTLVEQTERKMREHASPGVTVGVVKAERDVVGANITVASVHTLRSEKRLARIAPPDLIIVDEAHVSMSATYVRIFERFPRARVAGFTATWVRSDSKKLGDFWQKISFARDIRWAIKHGHLVHPRGISVGAPDDLLAGVRTRGGDYVDADLGEAVSVDTVRDNVVRGWREYAAARSSALFAPTVASAEFFREGLTRAGVPAAGIYANTSPRDRRRIFDAYRRREIAVLTTCTALAEGWDAPWCSAVFMVRPTKHAGLFIQIVGRGLRLWPSKTDCLVLDFVGGTQGMSLSLDAALAQSVTDIGDEDDETETRERLEPGERDDPVYLVGKGSKPIDLFAGSDARWQVTDLGVPFIATSTELYFLAQPPDSDTWSVGVCAIDRLRGGRWLREGLDLADATTYATIVAIDEDPSLARADSRWRRGKPSQAQIYRARSIGCVLSESDTRGDAADKLTLRQACITLAPIGAR